DVRYIRYSWERFEAGTALFCPVFAECNVLSDLVIEAAHVLIGVTKPVLVETLWACRVVPQVRVPETAERMVSSLVRPGVGVHISKLLQRRTQVATTNVR